MVLKLNLMVAVCENMGIGKNNNLPWRLKTEMEYFTKMTSATNTKERKNVVIMGRKTWDSIPARYKPLTNRYNFVLSRSNIDLSEYKDSYAFTSLEQALEMLRDCHFNEKFENVWVIGGSHVYKEAMNNKHFYRLYLTEIKKHYDCDIFFPPLADNLVEIKVPDVPKGVQEENGVKFLYKVYECRNEEVIR